jgi:hypothetical protein
MIIDQQATSIDKKGRPCRAYLRRSYTLAWVNWGKGPGIPEGHARGIKGVPEARYLPIGGETNVPKGPPYTSVQMPCASSYKNGASKFEVGPPDSKEYCISAIGEVKRNAAK